MADFGEIGKIYFVSFIKLRISSLTGAQSEFLKITPTANSQIFPGVNYPLMSLQLSSVFRT